MNSEGSTRCSQTRVLILCCWTCEKGAEGEKRRGSSRQWIHAFLAQHRAEKRCVMRHRTRVLLLLLLLLLGWPSGARRVRKKAPATRACLDLPEEILEQMFGRLSVGVMSAFHHALQLEPQDGRNLTCPSAARSRAGSKTRLPVHLLSVSPWAYRMSYDPARYPRYIPEAYCLCRGCLLGPLGEESRLHRSTPVYAPSVVLRRAGSCAGGRHSYTELYVSIAVGCTCVPLQEERDGRSLGRAEPKARRLGSAGTRPLKSPEGS